MMFEIIDKISDKLIDTMTNELKISKSLDVQMWSQRYTTDNIGNVAFGLECNCKYFFFQIILENCLIFFFQK
jgi:hypothetical protein